MIVRTLVAVLACSIGGKAIAAPAWTKSELPAALGFLALQCDRRDFCFAIACPDRKLQLVNISPGGGPYGNPDSGAAGSAATLTVGKEVFKLTFIWDDSIMPLAGDAGSRSALPVPALVALAEKNGAIEGFTTGPVKATMLSSGLKQLWPGITKACGLPALPH